MNKLYIAFLLISHSLFGQGIVINEFMSSNVHSIQDFNGKNEDWIELYNPGPSSVNLSGYHLSDNSANVLKWTFPSVVIASGQYLIIFASGNNKVYANGEVHTSFSISTSGEELILSDPSGIILDQTPSVNLGADISYGRQPDGTGPWSYFVTATPAASNTTTSYSGFLMPPSVSAQGGFYTSAFNLTITSSDPGATIRYTLDGSEPVDTSLIYTAPLPIASRIGDPNFFSLIPTAFPANWDVPSGEIEKATVVRVKVFKAGSIPSEMVTNTYFVDVNINSRFDMPVISLNTNQENLFDYVTGIDVPGKVFDDYMAANPGVTPDGGTPANYNQPGSAWEKVANIEYFEPNGTRGFAQKMGVDVHGNYSRASRQRSFNILADNAYDIYNEIDYPVFPGLTKQVGNKPLHKFKSLMIRNAGSDWGGSMMRDGFLQRLVSHTTLDIQDYRPVVLFVNGEYWGEYELREKPDLYYYENNYGISKDSITVMAAYNSFDEGDATGGSQAHYNNILSYAGSTNITTSAGFDYLNTQMDLDNYADYFASEIYWNNGDWPGNNVKYWRKNVAYDPNASYGADGRWRWLVYDIDFGFGFFNFTTINAWSAKYDFNTLDFATKAGLTAWPNPDWSTFLFRKMLMNPRFKNLFINRLADHLNSSFREARVSAKLAEAKNELVHEMPKQIFRWKAPGSFSYWNSHLIDMASYATKRPSYVRQHVLSHFGLTGTLSITLNVSDPNHGKIKINSLLINENTVGLEGAPYPWTGIYFQNIPIDVEAIPEPGYRFVRWEGGNTSNEAALTLYWISDQNLTAIFELDGHIDLYPNPTNGSFYIEVENVSNGNGTIQIVDMLGKEVFKSTFYKSQIKMKVPVDVSGHNIPMGLYVVRVDLGGKSYRRKLVIER
jgi:hypothetical protein